MNPISLGVWERILTFVSHVVPSLYLSTTLQTEARALHQIEFTAKGNRSSSMFSALLVNGAKLDFSSVVMLV